MPPGEDRSAELGLSGEGREQAGTLVPSGALDTVPGASQDTRVTQTVGSQSAGYTVVPFLLNLPHFCQSLKCWVTRLYNFLLDSLTPTYQRLPNLHFHPRSLLTSFWIPPFACPTNALNSACPEQGTSSSSQTCTISHITANEITTHPMVQARSLEFGSSLSFLLPSHPVSGDSTS